MYTPNINTAQYEQLGATSFSLLSMDEVLMILREVEHHVFEQAPPVLGRVHQRFSFAHVRPDRGSETMDIIHAFCSELQKLSTEGTIPLPEDFAFNEFIFNLYEYPQDVGISPHQDESKFKDLIAILVLQPGGTFYVCDDRRRRNAVAIPAEAGTCIIMRGGSSDGIDRRPIHYAAGIQTQRCILGLRYDPATVPVLV